MIQQDWTYSMRRPAFLKIDKLGHQGLPGDILWKTMQVSDHWGKPQWYIFVNSMSRRWAGAGHCVLHIHIAYFKLHLTAWVLKWSLGGISCVVLRTTGICGRGRIGSIGSMLAMECCCCVNLDRWRISSWAIFVDARSTVRWRNRVASVPNVNNGHRIACQRSLVNHWGGREVIRTGRRCETGCCVVIHSAVRRVLW